MKLFRTKIFKKDYQKLKMTDNQYGKYIRFLSLMLAEKELPLEARDHGLIGDPDKRDSFKCPLEGYKQSKKLMEKVFENAKSMTIPKKINIDELINDMNDALS